MPDSDSAIFALKKKLRKQMLERRKSESLSAIAQISLIAQNNVLNLPEWQDAAQVILYQPVNNELDTNLLMHTAWLEKKEVFLPRCLAAQKGVMELALCTDKKQLIPGKFGILEPDPQTCPAMQNNKITPQIMILPGLAFSPCGVRLGYGAGYYDRFLINNNTSLFAVGFCASWQLLPQLPHEHWDKGVDAVCTENEVIRCKCH